MPNTPDSLLATLPRAWAGVSSLRFIVAPLRQDLVFAPVVAPLWRCRQVDCSRGKGNVSDPGAQRSLQTCYTRRSPAAVDWARGPRGRFQTTSDPSFDEETNVMRCTGLAAALWMVLTGIGAAEEKTTAPRTISTAGDAVVYVAPDEVVVNLGVETLEPELEKASRSTTRPPCDWSRPLRTWASRPNRSRPTTSTSKSATRTTTSSSPAMSSAAATP